MSPKSEKWTYGGMFLSRRHASPNWHRCWYDAKSGQTRAVSLRTRDEEEAKRRLIAYVHEHGKIDTTDAAELAIWEILQRYEYQHVRQLTKNSAVTQRHNIGIMVDIVGDLPIAEFRAAKQREIVELMKERGYSDGYIKRIFGTTYAALSWTHQNDDIDRLPPKLRLPGGGRREFVATPAQLAAMWDELREDHMRMFFILSLSTAGRKSAILELTRFQCDMERGLIDLNPPGRAQNKKRRAVVPMTRLARAWISTVPAGPLVTYKGRQIQDVKIGWRAARERAGLPLAFSPHTIRHTVASWCRMQSLESWRVAALGGWREAAANTVEVYAKFDPGYFKPVIDAIDRLLEEVATEAKTSLNPSHRASNVRGVWKTGAGDEIRTHDPNLGKVKICKGKQ